MGAIKIGFGDVGIFDQIKSRTIWQVSGNVEFRGKANIGHGSKLSISGNLLIGKNFNITAESSIIVKKEIAIGKNVLISWDSLIMDTDFHKIYNIERECINEPSKITIGDNVWIGCRTLILKGVEIENGTIVGAGSVVSKSIKDKNCIAVGQPCKAIKYNVTWEE